MSDTARIFAAEDWKKIYQSLSQVDLSSYDFDNLRRVLLDYVKTNFPEDFNDFIDSSEFVALIDMMAYMGQSLAFRIDLNSRENFIDTAERKENVLRLARFLSYNPKRNVSAQGLLKIKSIKTTVAPKVASCETSSFSLLASPTIVTFNSAVKTLF